MGVDAHLKDRCDIARSKWVPDAYGADKEQWPPDVPMHLTDVHCHYTTKSQRVADTALAERPYTTTIRLLVPLRTDVRQGDRICNVVIKTSEGTETDPGPFRVEEIARRRGVETRHRSLLLERIGGG